MKKLILFIGLFATLFLGNALLQLTKGFAGSWVNTFALLAVLAMPIVAIAFLRYVWSKAKAKLFN